MNKRELLLKLERDGLVDNIQLVFGEPELTEYGDYTCTVTSNCPHVFANTKIAGQDASQALILAAQYVGLKLRSIGKLLDEHGNEIEVLEELIA